MKRDETAVVFFATAVFEYDGLRILYVGDSMLGIDISENVVRVLADGTMAGTIELYRNPFHMQNQYLKIDSVFLDTQRSAKLFRELSNRLRCSLQVMTYSENWQLIDFITLGGFVRKRRCYEIEAGRADYVGKAREEVLWQAKRGERAYDLCCEQMYDRYVETHREISPLTAERPAFALRLPDHAFYQKKAGKIVHFAFVEENEIAYAGSRADSCFVPFAEALISRLFRIYQTITFEADDCDQTAMQIRELFAKRDEICFDTYVYEYVCPAGKEPV